MKLGDIDGKGTVYDDSGQMLFHDGECASQTITGNTYGVYKKWKAGWKVVFMDGPGCFVITNLRSVFIRDPKSYPGGDDKVAKRLYSMSDGQYWPDKADKAKEAGAREYFVVYHDEIEQIKHGRRDSTIFVQWEGLKHKITVDKPMGEALEKVLTEGGMLK
jgi:hypothetical protein